MAVKIRLQRHGKKGKPFYWIVAADARSKRDGKYLEKIGTYDPNQKPAAIELNFDSALGWLDKGAQPTSTAKAILSYTGVLLKRHLDGGVKKGAFTEAEAKKKFDAWMKDKSAKIEKKIQDANAALESNKKEAREREEEYRKKKLEEAKAKEKAKARLKQTIIAIPFIGATAFAAFELNDFRKWKKENPSKEKSAYTCETASVYADLINEVLLELPENARPSERTINSLIEMCEN